MLTNPSHYACPHNHLPLHKEEEAAHTSDLIGLDGEQGEVVWSSPVCGPQVAYSHHNHQRVQDRTR